ncbi:MAG: PHP domain-containing protein [Chloroflexi bacterium]|nr:PHP domain-containing protein [Chloroflexota bacterium]
MNTTPIAAGERQGKADLHIHSAAGDGMAGVEEILDYAEEQGHLDVIAVTDHDEIRGALEAREIAARKNTRVQVVVGSEITTLDGHLIALFIEKPIRMLQSVEKTIAAIHKQNGMAIVPHPMSWLTLSVGQGILLRVMKHPCEDVYLDGIEMFNPSIAGRVAHKRARELNTSVMRLAEVGGSDSHQLHLIGTAHTVFEGRTIADLRHALVERTTKAAGEFWTANDHLQGAAGQQLKSLVIHPGQKIYRAIGSILNQDS